MSEMIRMLVDCSVTPSSPSISIWPSAVALPWLPIAGITNGSPPSARTSSPIARITRAMLAMPRLPAVIAIRAPGLIVSAKRRTCDAVSPSISSRTGPVERLASAVHDRERHVELNGAQVWGGDHSCTPESGLAGLHSEAGRCCADHLTAIRGRGRVVASIVGRPATAAHTGVPSEKADPGSATGS